MLRFGLHHALPLLLVVAVMKPAHAEERDTTLASPVVPLAAVPAPGVWYGWQVLAVDAATLGLTVGCLGSDSVDEAVCNIPLFGFLAGGPIVHATHAGTKRGLISLAMRLGLPVVGGIIGFSTADCPNPDAWLCGLSEMGAGIIAGTAVAVAVDSIWAFEDPGEASSRPPLRRASSSLTPTVKLAGQSTTFGLVGRF